MNNTPETIARMVADHHREMSPEQRMRLAASLYETARTIVASSLPQNMAKKDRRLAIARRFYGGELPEAALNAHAYYDPALTSVERAP